MSETIPPWTNVPCDECGQEFLASRTEPASPPHICEGCEMFERGRRYALDEVWADLRDLVIESNSHRAPSPRWTAGEALKRAVESVEHRRRQLRADVDSVPTPPAAEPARKAQEP
jgi:hypothetical protein